MQFSHPGSLDHDSPFPNFDPFGLPANDKTMNPAHTSLSSNSTFFTGPSMHYDTATSSTDDTIHYSGDVSELSDSSPDSKWRAWRSRTNSMDSVTDPSVGFFDINSLASVAARSSLKSAVKTLFSDNDLIRLVGSYPSLMLQKDFYPPFVHHKLYRCSEGGVAEPLANALCCVSAYVNMVPSSEAFVYQMINRERDRLVRGFHSWSSSDVNALGALHAMCVYQILGLLDIKDPHEVRNAELQHPFFLKMTRRLCQENLRLNFGKDENTDWKTWVVAETLRRTVFLVNIVNTLSCRIHTQNPSYYEALDEQLILGMTLPAPDPMWRACTSEEWESAKRSLNWSTRKPLTVKMVIDRLEEGHTNEANRDWFENFQPLSVLIIACVRLHL